MATPKVPVTGKEVEAAKLDYAGRYQTYALAGTATVDQENKVDHPAQGNVEEARAWVNAKKQ